MVTTATTGTERSFWLRNMWILLLTAILVGTAIFMGVTLSNNSAQIEAQKARIEQLRGQVTTATNSRQTTVDDSMAQALGVTPSRLSTDKQIIGTLMEQVFTWSSGETYDAARTTLKQRYKFSEKSEFLTGFMPPARFNQDSTGKRYYYIDGAGLSSSLGGPPRVEVVRVSGTQYQYAVIATVVSKSALPDKSTARATRLVLLYVTVDGQGVVSDVHGVPPSGTTRTSG